MTSKRSNKEIMLQNKNELKNLEQAYIDNKILEMPKYLEEQKKKITKEIIKYAEEHENKLNPLVITNYFFKPITNLSCVEPVYSPEQLGMVFDYYCHIVAEINEKIDFFPTSLTSFCKLAGLTMNTLRTYRNSSDYNMRIIVEKIYDQIGDENLTMSQMGIVNERSTIFKLKSQNELVEKEQPKINVNIVEKPNFDEIEAKIRQYNQFSAKKEK